MPPFNHVHTLTETVKAVKQVMWPTKCLNKAKKADLQLNSNSKHIESKTFKELSVQASPILKNAHCDFINWEMSRDAKIYSHVVKQVKLFSSPNKWKQ